MRFAKTIAAGAAGALLIATGIIFGQFIKHSSEPDPIPIGGAFELVDQEGHSVTDKSFLGRPSVISFGYTSCPDVCPTTLMDLSNWLRALGSHADKLNVLFISIDPERDTPPHLRESFVVRSSHTRINRHEGADCRGRTRVSGILQKG